MEVLFVIYISITDLGILDQDVSTRVKITFREKIYALMASLEDSVCLM